MAQEEDIWTVKRCMDWTIGFLERNGEERPRLAAEWLLCAAMDMKRIDLYLNLDRPMSEEERAYVRSGLQRRRKGEPLQYIIGETSFRTLELFCEPGVLIPRPETELLVEVVLSYLDHEVLGGPATLAARRTRTELPWNAEVERAREAERAAQRERAANGADTAGEAADLEDVAAEAALESAPAEAALGVEAVGVQRDADALGAASTPDATGEAAAVPTPRRARVLEVGCGTGCISLSLASERAGLVTCVATDIEPRAVALAQRNRTRAQVDAAAVDIREGDLVAPVRPEEYGTFDVLVSNPPYVPSSVVDTLTREVRAFEPRLALDGGTDGLDIFRRLLDEVPRMLRPGGLFACELFETATEPAAEFCRAAGLVEVRVVPDLATRPRFVVARRPR